MKKFVCLLIAVVMLLSMFAGCGAKTEEPSVSEQAAPAATEKAEAAAPSPGSWPLGGGPGENRSVRLFRRGPPVRQPVHPL